MNNKQLILSLIKDDILNSKLVNGLNEMGLQAENYYLHLSDTIFKLMGFEDNENMEHVFEKYIALTRRAKSIHVSHSHQVLDKLALQIYKELSAQKPSAL